MFGRQIGCVWACDAGWANLNLLYRFLKTGLCVDGWGAGRWEVGREGKTSDLSTLEGVSAGVAGSQGNGVLGSMKPTC